MKLSIEEWKGIAILVVVAGCIFTALWYYYGTAVVALTFLALTVMVVFGIAVGTSILYIVTGRINRMKNKK